MNDILNKFNDIKDAVKSYFEDNCLDISKQNFNIDNKVDDSIVTKYDNEVSKLIKKIIQSEKKICFYSEEYFSELSYPALVVDPIDGTKEFAKLIPECAVSVAYLNSANFNDPLNYAWIYNPFTGFEIESGHFKIKKNIDPKRDNFLCLVSNSEWKKDIYKNLGMEKVLFSPKGSIAFKLGLLAAGACDLICSVYPKNIWDIAAGTILCHQAGIDLFLENTKVVSFDSNYPQIMKTWISEDIKNNIKKDFSKICGVK